MQPCICVRTVTISVLLLFNSVHSLSADQPNDWIKSSGDDLQIRLQGEVFEPDGRVATDFAMIGSLNANTSRNPIHPAVDGNRFEVWIPVNRAEWFSLWIKASSRSGERVAYKRLTRDELRQAAIDGIKLTLQPATRVVEVKVTDLGQPVSGAHVKAEVVFNIELLARTDESGIARFALLPDQTLSDLMAWTDDFRIGGYSFHRKPARDPSLNQHVVELSKCRRQKLRFVDEAGTPVPEVQFVFYVATPEPNFNFIGTNEHTRMTSDSAGEATFRWFPDWEKHHFYAEPHSDRWIPASDLQLVDGVAVLKLKKAKDRRRVRGSVSAKGTGAGGFFVTLSTFQSEQENMVDEVSVFTDSDGQFAVNVLADATYCAYALDSRWAGDIIDLIPYRSETDQTVSPRLSVSEGELVEVLVTSGPLKKPYPNLSISFRRDHDFSWREDGKTQHGAGGPQWWATTDESGRAITRTFAGELEASIYTPLWRAKETVEVRSGDVARITMHREVAEKRKVAGRLILTGDSIAKLSAAEIRIDSVDGKYEEDDQTLKGGQDGSFSFETGAVEIGIFASTSDGRASGGMTVKNPPEKTPIELPLRPTIDYQGKLLGKGDQPLVGHGVQASIALASEQSGNNGIVTGRFEAKRIAAKTDDQGNFTLRGLPSNMPVSIYAERIDGSADNIYLGEVFLEPNETRPRAVSRLTTPVSSISSVADRYKKTLRDCALSGFHLMVITSNGDAKAARFVSQNFLDGEANEDVSTFMQLVVAGQKALAPGDATFLAERKWAVPAEERVLAIALDSKGTELGRVEFDINSKDATQQAAKFVHQHAPPQLDAEKKWKEAIAEASRTNRRVWARISQRYCGPCFLFARWLDDHRELLEKDYVLLKIDDVRDKSGAEVAGHLTRGKHYGIPFHAIFDTSELLLIDSAGPLGNIGNPSGFEGKKQLRKMLLQTKRRLTDAEVEKLVASIED